MGRKGKGVAVTPHHRITDIAHHRPGMGIPHPNHDPARATVTGRDVATIGTVGQGHRGQGVGRGIFEMEESTTLPPVPDGHILGIEGRQRMAARTKGDGCASR